jgi:hypothetical protein
MERTREPGRSRPDRRDDRASGHPATLTVAAVPIGRPEDASPRLAAALSEAPIMAAEDTRRLASALGVPLGGLADRALGRPARRGDNRDRGSQARQQPADP